MSRLAGRWVPLVVLVVAVLALASSVAWVLGPANNTATPWRHRPMIGSGGGMLPGSPGAGPVRDLDDARQTAQRFADGWGLQVGEVMQFSNGFYAELLDNNGRGATEVLIDPSSGALQIEYGPAMMWNTAFGMMPGAGQPRRVSVSPDQARTIADRWLEQNRSGLRAGEAEAFPGYYTLHTVRGQQVVGMLSVNAATGAVWYHTWHGRFVRMQEPADTGHTSGP